MVTGWPSGHTLTLVAVTKPAVLVAGRYRLDERVGAGAMGVVWKAVDERLGRTVAVKQMILPPGLDSGAAQEAKLRIMREGRIAARLHHPNAVAVFDVADHDGQPWLVMEYVQSRSLAAVLIEGGPLPPAEVATIGSQLANALAAAHAAGIVHRDVKPGNVLLGDSGTVKLTDFGISHATDDVTVTRTGMLAGTPAYLAPEIARGVDPTAASDVFSLGATLYTAVEGEPPFGVTDNTLALLHLVAAGAIRPPRQAGPLTATLMRLLSSEPAERPTAAHARGILAAVAKAGHPAADQATRQISATGTAPTPMPTPMPNRMPNPVVSRRPATATRVGLPPLPAAPAAEPARPARRGKLVPVALVSVLVLLIVLLVIVATRKVSDRSGAAPTQSNTLAPTTTAPATPSQPAPPTARQLQEAVDRYYALLPDNLDQAWQLLGPDMRAGGHDSYTKFWGGFESVRAQVQQANPTRMTVRVVVAYFPGNRQPIAELHELTMIQESDGDLLINRDKRLGSAKVPEGGRGGGDGGRSGGG
jgi:eukaryotic-like serine/threonine-protein kinase